MKLNSKISILLFVTATLSLINGGHAKNVNTVPTTSELEEGILNKQDENDGGGGSVSTIASPKHAAVRNLHPQKIMAVVDKAVATAFGLVGVQGLTHKIDEEESIDILTGIVSKADEFESAIISKEGGRRLQSFGTNNNLFLAYIQVSVLKLQGLDDTAILERVTERFTERIVNIIAGILDPTPATTSTTSTTTVAQGIVALQPTGGGMLVTEQQSSGDFSGIVSFSFTPTSNIQVTKLGGYDPQGDGFANDHTIGIFNTAVDTTPLASITIPAGSSPAGATLVADEDAGGNGGTWFVPITPITLTAGTRYDIIGQGFTDPDLFLNGILANYNIGQDLTSVLGGRPSITGIVDSSTSEVFFGPNFEYNLL